MALFSRIRRKGFIGLFLLLENFQKTIKRTPECVTTISGVLIRPGPRRRITLDNIRMFEFESFSLDVSMTFCVSHRRNNSALNVLRRVFIYGLSKSAPSAGTTFLPPNIPQILKPAPHLTRVVPWHVLHWPNIFGLIPIIAKSPVLNSKISGQPSKAIVRVPLACGFLNLKTERQTNGFKVWRRGSHRQQPEISVV